ncbi:MAG: hypothetical protein JST05_00150 [Acidobacteria bacterium]|nr:hypothetical protein [Acidobacteriota bacterium]
MSQTSRILTALAAALLTLGCTGGSSSSTSGTALYLFDATAPEILVWKDLGATASAATTPSADLTLTSSALTQTASLAWGGMALDTQRNRLYLLYQNGTVIRIDQIRSQSGAIQTSNLIVFTLDSSQRLTGSVFGQLALDSQSDTLYACESGTSGNSRIWAVANPDSLTNGSTATLQAITDTQSPTGAAGVAAGQNAAYAYFANGSQVISGTTTYNGPRLRKGTASAFDPNATIIGGDTGLDQSTTGSLALDTANNVLFVGMDAGSTSTSSPTGGAPVVAFQTGQFGLSANQTPTFWLGNSSTGAIKALAHPGIKAWLVGLQASGTNGTQTILVWKAPASGVSAQSLTLGPSGSQYLGAALDGTGS